MSNQKDKSAVLSAIIERLSALEDEKAEIADQMKAILADAKVDGWKPPVLRQMVKEYRMTTADRVEMYLDLDAYRKALGLLAGTPLGDAAMARRCAADLVSPGVSVWVGRGGKDSTVKQFPGNVPAPSDTEAPAAG